MYRPVDAPAVHTDKHEETEAKNRKPCSLSFGSLAIHGAMLRLQQPYNFKLTHHRTSASLSLFIEKGLDCGDGECSFAVKHDVAAARNDG